MIEFKITADNAVDFIADLLATASKLTGATQVTADPASKIVAEEAAPVKEKPAAAPKRQPKAETGNASAAAEKATAAATTADASTVAPESSSKPTSGNASSESTSESKPSTSSEGAEGRILDFDKDVAPLVLGYVKSHGRPWVVEVLEQFGVARASELPAERLGELVDMLNEKAAA